MSYRAGIAIGPYGLEATVFDLPGCWTQAVDEQALRELLPVAIAEHEHWLARHGEHREVGSIEVDLVEHVRPSESDAADGELVFADDCRPIGDTEIEQGIRHMGYATADLLHLTGDLSDTVLDWRPPVTAMEKIDPWQLHAKTIREIARELPASEHYYRLGLSAGNEGPPDEAIFDRALQRQLMVERLKSLAAQERGKVFEVTRSWQDRPEHWTARKVIRRTISHERFHTKEIEQRLAWILLGVPTFAHAMSAAEEEVTMR